MTRCFANVWIQHHFYKSAFWTRYIYSELDLALKRYGYPAVFYDASQLTSGGSCYFRKILGLQSLVLVFN